MLQRVLWPQSASLPISLLIGHRRLLSAAHDRLAATDPRGRVPPAYLYLEEVLRTLPSFCFNGDLAMANWQVPIKLGK
jgi:hypothetical protein